MLKIGHFCTTKWCNDKAVDCILHFWPILVDFEPISGAKPTGRIKNFPHPRLSATVYFVILQGFSKPKIQKLELYPKISHFSNICPLAARLLVHMSIAYPWPKRNNCITFDLLLGLRSFFFLKSHNFSSRIRIWA